MTMYCKHQSENCISVSSSACRLAHPPFLLALLFVLQFCLTCSQRERVLLNLALIFNVNLALMLSKFFSSKSQLFKKKPL